MAGLDMVDLSRTFRWVGGGRAGTYNRASIRTHDAVQIGRHLVKPGYAVEVDAGGGQVWVGLVTKLWEDLDTDMKMMRLQWLYRPHDTAQGRVPDQVENSVCLSNHADDNPLDTFLAPAFVQFVRGEATPHGLTTYVCRHRYDGVKQRLSRLSDAAASKYQAAQEGVGVIQDELSTSDGESPGSGNDSGDEASASSSPEDSTGDGGSGSGSAPRLGSSTSVDRDDAAAVLGVTMGASSQAALAPELQSPSRIVEARMVKVGTAFQAAVPPELFRHPPALRTVYPPRCLWRGDASKLSHNAVSTFVAAATKLVTPLQRGMRVGARHPKAGMMQPAVLVSVDASTHDASANAGAGDGEADGSGTVLVRFVGERQTTCVAVDDVVPHEAMAASKPAAALEELLHANHDTGNALSALASHARQDQGDGPGDNEPSGLHLGWTNGDVLNFSKGFNRFGCDFAAIRRHFLKHMTTAAVVEFYGYHRYRFGRNYKPQWLRHITLSAADDGASQASSGTDPSAATSESRGGAAGAGAGAGAGRRSKRRTASHTCFLCMEVRQSFVQCTNPQCRIGVCSGCFAADVSQWRGRHSQVWEDQVKNQFWLCQLCLPPTQEAESAPQKKSRGRSRLDHDRKRLRATVCAPVQDSENTMAVALKFLHAVRQSCGGDGSKTYTTFLRLLRNFDRGAVGIDKVVSTTRRLFKDHADLMIEFENFLPSQNEGDEAVARAQSKRRRVA